MDAPKETSGDPYLNFILREVARHWVYPPLALSLGLSGTAIYRISIDRGGRLLDVTLEKSTGSSLLDEAGFRMIRATAPFPAPPSDQGMVLIYQAEFAPPR
jgi:protein TonB